MLARFHHELPRRSGPGGGEAPTGTESDRSAGWKACAWGALALALVAAAPAAGPADAWSLYRGLMDGGEVVYVVPPEVDLARVERAVENLERSCHLRGRIAVQNGAGPIAPAERGSRIVLGGFGMAPARELAEHAGIEPMARGFRYEGRSYTDDLDAVVVTFEDPARPGRPVTLVFGNEPARLVWLLSGPLPAWRPYATCYAEGELERAAPLGPGLRWMHSLQRSWEIARARRRFTDREVRLARFSFAVPDGTDPAELDALAATCDRARARFLAWAAPAVRVPRIDVVVHTHPEDMGATQGIQDLAWFDPLTERVHALLTPGITHDGGAAVARATAVAVLGHPRDPWLLDAAGVSAAGKWWDRPLLAWAAWLHRAGLVPPLEELVATRAPERSSPHVVSPLRAMLLETLLATRGRKAVLELWLGQAPLAIDAALREAFAQRMDLALRLHGPAMDELARERLRQARLGEFRNGIAFAREGDPLRGYAARDAAVSLARAAARGANALAVSVAGYQDPGLPLEGLRSGYGGRPASDTDVALAQAIAAGRGLGMRALLQPELLTTPWGGLAGQRVMPELDEWEAFFDALGPFLVHYALLAELTGCELLSVGSDMPAAVGLLPSGGEAGDGDEDEARLDSLVLARQQLREREWEDAVDRVRRCFSGGLTYGAGWSFPRVSFSSQLDFLGCSLFEPVSRMDHPGLVPVREQLVRRLAGTLGYAADRAAAQGCAAIVTAAGFTSTERTWVTPGTPRGRSDLETQRAMYEMLVEALRRQRWREDRVQGLFLWKWSTEPASGGHGDRGFTPQNKPAEDLLDALFGVF